MCSVSPVNSKHYYLLAQCGNMRRSSFAQATFVDFVTIKEKIWKIIFHVLTYMWVVLKVLAASGGKDDCVCRGS